MDLDDIIGVLEDAITELYKDNWFFFQSGVGEWTVSSEFHHIMKKKYWKRFKGYDMDAEFNLMTGIDRDYVQKTIVSADGTPLTIRPDFIIHKQDCPKKNLLCVEIKRKGGAWLEHDYYKLAYLTRKSDDMAGRYVSNYAFGVSVLMLKRKVKCRWYENGKAVKNRTASVVFNQSKPSLNWQ